MYEVMGALKDPSYAPEAPDIVFRVMSRFHGEYGAGDPVQVDVDIANRIIAQRIADRLTQDEEPRQIPGSDLYEFTSYTVEEFELYGYKVTPLYRPRRT